MKNKIQRFTFLFISLWVAILIYGQSQSKLLHLDEGGKLKYDPYTDEGDVIPDFSHCGYMGGGIAIPDVKAEVVINDPSGGDDTPLIQEAIDKVSKMNIKPNGFRGAVLLKKGIYKISSPLKITVSGIILRGEGNYKENGTVLLAISKHKYNVIEIGVSAKLRAIKSSEKYITNDYVPSGSKVLHVKDAAKLFRAGDAVVVHRPSTAAWIHAIGMDSIAPRPLQGETSYDSFLRYRKFGDATNMNGTKQWQQGSRDLLFERTIVAVDGDKITLDIPVVNALQKEFGGARIYKYEFPERISHCGVENIYGMSVYDETVTQNHKNIGDYYSDENHANNFIFCRAVENAWVRNVSVEHFDCCVGTSAVTKFFTGQDLSAINPVSVITGGRRYAYSVSGQMNLFQRCYSSHHRHEFVLGANVAGPNAFVDGSGDMTFASSEPHQRWATGCLFDNITIKGPAGSLLAVNRGWFGSGHGWAGAQMVFWNCGAPVIIVMQPPTAQNFAIGSNEVIEDEWSTGSRESTIRSINAVSLNNFKYQGYASVGDGWVEQADKLVNPRSLYYQQLKDRLGVAAVKAVMSEEQIKVFFAE